MTSVQSAAHANALLTVRPATRRPQWYALLASVLLLAGLVLLLTALQWAADGQQPKLMVREVSTVAVLPPPPPPPPVSNSAPPPMMAMAVPGAGAVLPVEFALSAPTLPALLPPPTMAMSEPQWQDVTVDWQAVSLDALDALPSLLTPVRIAFPNNLRRQGINHVLVKLDVVIDEQGMVHLQQVVSNPYPELKPEIDKMVKQSRFTAPKQGEQAVRARFIWPVELSYE